MLNSVVAKFVGLAMLALTLSGCGAPLAAPVAVLHTAPAAAHQPAIISDGTLRRVLATSGSRARIWGLSFVKAEDKILRGSTRIVIPDWDKYGNYKPRKYDKEYKKVVWKIVYSQSAEGTIEHLDQGRFLYEVPEDQVLVLNMVEKAHQVSINGFPLRQERDETGANSAIHYLFGPGELLVLEFGRLSSLSGYTADPALFAGMATFSGGAK